MPCCSVIPTRITVPGTREALSPRPAWHVVQVRRQDSSFARYGLHRWSSAEPLDAILSATTPRPSTPKPAVAFGVSARSVIPLVTATASSSSGRTRTAKTDDLEAILIRVDEEFSRINGETDQSMNARLLGPLPKGDDDDEDTLSKNKLEHDPSILLYWRPTPRQVPLLDRWRRRSRHLGTPFGSDTGFVPTGFPTIFSRLRTIAPGTVSRTTAGAKRAKTPKVSPDAPQCPVPNS